jgi:GntR family transcriptional regulator
MIQSSQVRSIPAELAEEHLLAPLYRRVHKLHSFRGTPFTLLDIYVDAEIHARFPPGEDRRHKLSWLMRQYGQVEIDHSREELTITHADQSASNLLQYPIAAPLARLRRWHFSREGRVMYACIALYRGDLFVWDVSQAGPARETLDRQIIPGIRIDGGNGAD